MSVAGQLEEGGTFNFLPKKQLHVCALPLAVNADVRLAHELLELINQR
jgi:hypothetical protein